MEVLSGFEVISKWCESHPNGVLVSTKINQRKGTYTQHLATCNMFRKHNWQDGPGTYYCYENDAEVASRAEGDGIANRNLCGRPGINCYR